MGKKTNSHREKYFRMFEEIKKIVENEPPTEYGAEQVELEFPSRRGFILCTGSIVPEDNPVANIKYSD